MAQDKPTSNIQAEDAAQLWTRTVEFARGQLKPTDLVDRDRTSQFWAEGWRRCAQFGVQGMPVPAQYGGLSLTVESSVTILEALGYACPDAGLLFSLNAHLWSVLVPIWLYGTSVQRDRYLSRLANGDLIGAHAISEPGAGSDAFALRTLAVAEGDSFLLDGHKLFVTNAPIADVFLIFARLEGTHGPGGITAFLVERDTPGLTIGLPAEKMGLRTSPMASVQLDRCRVGLNAILGEQGRAAPIFNSSMLWERSCIMAPLVGAMQARLEATIEYAQGRRQFGKPIGEFQLVSEKIVDMRLGLDNARAMLHQTARSIDAGSGGLLEASISKLCVSESAVAFHRHALQIYGAYGYMTENSVERELRDVLGSTIYSGTSEIQRYIIARLLGL